MNVEQLLADIRADQKTIAEAACNLGPAMVKINALTRALARLGCSCCVKTREVDLEAHEVFCLYRSAMEDMS